MGNCSKLVKGIMRQPSWLGSEMLSPLSSYQWVTTMEQQGDREREREAGERVQAVRVMAKGLSNAAAAVARKKEESHKK